MSGRICAHAKDVVKANGTSSEVPPVAAGLNEIRIGVEFFLETIAPAGGTPVHFIIRATIPNTLGNALMRDGAKMERTFQNIIDDLKPETVYYCLEKGQRTIYFIVNVEKESDWPRFGEPLWLGLQADVEVILAMTQDQFMAAQPVIQGVVPKYV
jgi:hypothetical protein